MIRKSLYLSIFALLFCFAPAMAHSEALSVPETENVEVAADLGTEPDADGGAGGETFIESTETQKAECGLERAESDEYEDFADEDGDGGLSDRTRIFSLGFDALLFSLRRNGWGFGCSFEQYLAFHTAFKANIRHCTFVRNGELFPSVNFGLAAEYYPLSLSLDKLYLSLGGGFDYLAYSDDEYSEEAQREFVSVIPELGWKWTVNDYVALDIHAGYKYVFEKQGAVVPSDYGDYLKKGPTAGVGVKVRFLKLFRDLRRRRGEE